MLRIIRFCFEVFVVEILKPRKVAFYMEYRGAPLAHMRRPLTGYVSLSMPYTRGRQVQVTN